MSSVVLYHSHCFDGTMAAAAAMAASRQGVLDANEKTGFYSIHYGKSKVPEFFEERGPYDYLSQRNKGIERFYFLDFCPNPDVVLELVRRGHKVTIIDHHATAEEDTKKLLGIDEVDLYFDMTMSGASMAWAHFHGEVPLLAQYVEDRDLWKWSLPDTKQVIAWLSTVAETNKPDSYLTAIVEFDNGPYKAVYEGSLLVKAMDTQVERMAKKFRLVELEGFGKGAIVEAPVYPSEVCEHVYENNQVAFVLGYALTGDNRVALSFRSKPGVPHSVDVSQIARNFGGGGHKNASGGSTELETLFELLNSSVAG